MLFRSSGVFGLFQSGKHPLLFWTQQAVNTGQSDTHGWCERGPGSLVWYNRQNTGLHSGLVNIELPVSRSSPTILVPFSNTNLKPPLECLQIEFLWEQLGESSLTGYHVLCLT